MSMDKHINLNNYISQLMVKRSCKNKKSAHIKQKINFK